MRKKPSHLTRMILLVSFVILFGRLLYSSIAAIARHQGTNQTQIEQPVTLQTTASRDATLSRQDD